MAGESEREKDVLGINRNALRWDGTGRYDRMAKNERNENRYHDDLTLARCFKAGAKQPQLRN